jgi:hypothetical protein
LEIQSCTHQEENRCDASTGLSRIVSLIPLASIHDRDSIFRMIDVVEAGTSNAAASFVSGTVSVPSVHEARLALQTAHIVYSRRSSTRMGPGS